MGDRLPYHLSNGTVTEVSLLFKAKQGFFCHVSWINDIIVVFLLIECAFPKRSFAWTLLSDQYHSVSYQQRLFEFAIFIDLFWDDEVIVLFHIIKILAFYALDLIALNVLDVIFSLLTTYPLLVSKFLVLILINAILAAALLTFL